MNVYVRLTIYLCISCLMLGQANAVEKTWLDKTVTPADARHLLARTGFDAAPELQRQIAGLTRREAIDALIAGFEKKPAIPMPAWTNDTAPLYWTRRDLDSEQQRQFDRLRDSELAQLRNWWVDEMLVTPSPQTERMVLFWHDHFATSYHGIARQSIAMARQNQTFRNLGMGDFESLLKAMIRDPALLQYLNNTSNKRGKPNENLARELLELFTLGEGNYQEATVREAARALTGYTVSRNNNLQPRFNHWQHDPELKTLFGETGHFNSDDLVTLILQQSALDRFIATGYWHWLIADRKPSNDEIQPLATAFRASGHHLGDLYRSTLESKAFWHSDNRGGLIKSPVTLLVGTARTLGYPNGINEQLPNLLKLSGQDLFAPPNVAGWQEGAAWITPGRLLNRYSALQDILAATRKARPVKSAEGANVSMMDEASSDTAMSMADMDAPTMSMADTGMADTGMADTGMAETTTLMNSDANSRSIDQAEHLTLKLAAEEYQGPAHYRIELLDSNDAVTWSSGEHAVAAGWDTARYGMVESRDQLPWRDLVLPIETSLFASADTLRVHFVNDDAGDNGDRNLYVGTLRANAHSVSPKLGSQSSQCPPPNAADAGDLHCAGYVDFDVQALQAMAVTEPSGGVSKNTVQYASKHIEWAAKNNSNGNSNARLVFQDVRFGQRHWPIFSAWYRIIGENEPVLWLHNQDCWPDCLDQWPSCAWTSDLDSAGRTIGISSLGARDDEKAACQVDGLSDLEAAMIDGLLIQGSTLLQQALVAETERFPIKREGVKIGLNTLISELNQPAVTNRFLQSSPTERTALDDVPEWVQSDAARRPYPQDQRTRDLPSAARDLLQRHEQVINAGFTLPTVLAPGIPIADLPGWGLSPKVNTDVNSDVETTREQLQEQVRSWLLNPAYQVH